MTVKKKVTKEKMMSCEIDEIINRGGKVSADYNEKNINKEIRFTLRIPKKLIDEIDIERSNRSGNISRNQWIIEVIDERLK